MRHTRYNNMIKQITDGMHAFRFGVSVMLVVFLTSALQSDACAQSLGATLIAGDIPCEGGTASVTITASGGQSPYTYSVNGGSSYQNSPGFQLAAGLYTQIHVLDANGTVYVLSSIEISDGPPGPPTTYFPDADADGFGLGNSVQLCYDPGAGYSLINSDCNDSNPFVNPNEPESCNGIDDNCNGSTDEGLVFENYYADADGDGFGTGAPLYLCSDPGVQYATNAGDCNDASSSINPSATESCNGIDDNCNGLIDTYDPLLSPAGPLALTANVSQVLCHGGTGSVALSASGGSEPYDFGSTAVSSLLPGTYVYTLTDANGCQVHQTVSITQPLPLVVTCTATPILCFGDSAIAVVSATGGTTPYSGVGSFAIAAGLFHPVVTDANGCTASPSPLQCNTPAEITSSFSQISCNSYTWNGTTYSQSGTYVQVLQAANGCDSTVTLSLTITAAQFPIVLSASVTNAGCPGAQTGAVDLNVSGGTAPFTYAWSGGQTTQDVTGLSAGVIQVVVSDAVGCQTAADYTVLEPGQLPALGAIQGTAVSCVSQVPGTAVFSVAPVSDGFNTTTYVWSAPIGFSIVSGQGTSTVTMGWTAASIDPSITGNIQVTASTPCAAVSQSLAVSYALVKPVTPGSISGSAKVCPGETVTYSVAAVARATEYAWVLPAGMTFVGSSNTNVIQVQVSASYMGGDVKVCAGNACGFSGLRTRTTSLNSPLTPGVITGQVTGLCNASLVNYSIAAVSGATSYDWVAPAGATIVSGQGTTQISISYGTVSTGQISVRSSNACGLSALRTITVSGLPGRPDPITATPAGTPCAGTSVTYGVPTVTGASSYTWATSSGGSILAGQGTKTASISWSASAAGVLQFISVRSVNACGQSSTRSIQLTPSSCVRNFESVDGRLSVFPSPGRSTFTVRALAETEGVFELRALDLSGRVIETRTGVAEIGENIYSWPETAASWLSGVYFVEWRQGLTLYRARLIVE